MYGRSDVWGAGVREFNGQAGPDVCCVPIRYASASQPTLTGGGCAEPGDARCLVCCNDQALTDGMTQLATGW